MAPIYFGLLDIVKRSNKKNRKLDLASQRQTHVISCISRFESPVQVTTLQPDFGLRDKGWREPRKELHAHSEIMFNARCHTGNEFEEHDQVLVHSDGDLFFLVVL